MLKEQCITGELLARMIFSGANHLSNKKTIVDNLNVFPVPDGDTGTNMSMTIHSAARFIHQIEEQKTLKNVSEKVSYGALMGARGNSGVILSQVLAGFVEALKDEDCAGVKAVKKGFFGGSQKAYQAVTNPMEGTILTVVREAYEAVEDFDEENGTLLDLFDLYLKAGYKSLENTPELLPVLKQAGVVDAGGQGFLFFVEGMKLAYLGEDVSEEKEVSLDVDLDESFNHFFVNPDDIVFQYCTEFLIQGVSEDPTEKIKNYLLDKGDCTLVIYVHPTVKIHVHTNNPGGAMEFCSQFGELDDIKINNMKTQNRLLQEKAQLEETKAAHKAYSVIAVCSGEGLAEIFKSMGVDHIIAGGQTMNPSTEDFLKAIDEVDADNIVILPNNKNVILSAEHAKNIRQDLSIAVLPTKYLPQGICAMMNFKETVTLEENVEMMNEMLDLVSTGEVTKAIRDTKIGEVEITTGDFLAIYNGKIVASVSTLMESLDKMMSLVEEEGKEFVTVYTGVETKDEGQTILEKLEESYPDLEFELHYGGQEVYHVMLSAE